MSGAREPVFNAPWPVTALVGLLLGLYLFQLTLPEAFVYGRLGFSAAGLAAGERAPLVTALFVHGGWAHVLLNAAGALAFGAPISRFLGARLAGALAYLGFFLVCGVLASLGYALVNPGETAVLVGASGAVSGLMGAASRLIAGRGQLGPMRSAPVIGMGAAWVIVNLLVGLLGVAPGMGDAQVAWEAHLFGYAAGLLLIGPLAWVMRRVTALKH